MQIKILVLILALLLVATTFLIVSSFLNKNITGRIINEYSYTKAICNETNYCQDYEIICKEGEILSRKPITGATVQHPQNWQDPREQNPLKPLCE